MCASTSAKGAIFKNIRIVLVSPQVPENIGLCARVMKNTLFDNLCLVKPNLNGKSFEVAKRARDILEKAKLFDNLKSALGDSHFVFGTTRRKRSYKAIYNFQNVLPFIVAFAKKHKITIIFGKENFGLSKDEMSLCDSVFYIPSASTFPSYNLAFSVGIVCYKIFEYVQNILDIDYLELARKKEIESLFLFIEETLKKIRIKGNRKEASLYSLRRILSRTALTRNEAQLLKSIFVAINRKL